MSNRAAFAIYLTIFLLSFAACSSLSLLLPPRGCSFIPGQRRRLQVRRVGGGRQAARHREPGEVQEGRQVPPTPRQDRHEGLRGACCWGMCAWVRVRVCLRACLLVIGLVQCAKEGQLLPFAFAATATTAAAAGVTQLKAVGQAGRLQACFLCTPDQYARFQSRPPGQVSPGVTHETMTFSCILTWRLSCGAFCKQLRFRRCRHPCSYVNMSRRIVPGFLSSPSRPFLFLPSSSQLFSCVVLCAVCLSTKIFSGYADDGNPCL